MRIAGRIYRWHTPKAIPLIVVIGAFLTLLGLSGWQLERLAWKENLIAELEAAKTNPPIATLPRDKAEIEALAFRRVALHGHFLNDHEFHLANRFLNGMPGYHILTPFQLDDGRLLLLNRGWVPFDSKEPSTRAAGLVTGEIGLIAMVRTDSDRNLMMPTPQNPADGEVPPGEPASGHPRKQNIWLWKNLPLMRQVSGLDLGPYTLDVLNMAVPGGLPKPLTGNIQVRNDHLGYAITWFLLALGILVLFIAAHLKPETPEENHA